MERNTLKIVSPDTFPEAIEVGDAKVWGVILAGGTSSRFGEENKLLITLDGVPVVRHVATSLLNSDLDGVTVIVGYESQRVREALDGLSVEIRLNAEYSAGQSTSVHEGVTAAWDHDADAVVIALGDMPLIADSTINLLIKAYTRGIADIIVAAANGKRGNPVLFDNVHFETLSNVEGDIGARALIQEADDVVGVETANSGVLYDIDTPSDLQRFGDSG